MKGENAKKLVKHPRWEPLVLLALALTFTACADDKVSFSGNWMGGGAGSPGGTVTPDDPVGPGGVVINNSNGLIHLFERGVEHDLAPGETLPGVHLRPGVGLIAFDEGVSRAELIVDYDAMTVELRGAVRADFETLEEVWTGDIVMGPDFIFSLVDLHISDSVIVIDVAEFELLSAIHGDWRVELDDLNSAELEEFEAGVRRQLQETTEGPGEAKMPFEVEEIFGLTTSGSVDVSTRNWSDESTFEGRIPFAGGSDPEYTCPNHSTTERVCRSTRRGTRCRGGSVENYCVEYVLVKNTVDVHTQLGLTLEAQEAHALLKREYAIREQLMRGLTKKGALGTTGLAIYVVPEAKVGAEAGAFGAGSISLGIDEHLAIPIGFEYISGRPPSRLPNANHRPTLSQDFDLDASGEWGLRAKGFGKLALKLELANVVSNRNGPKITGPEAGLEVGGELIYTPVPRADPRDEDATSSCLTAELYLRAYGQVKLRGEVEVNAFWTKWTWGVDLTGTATTGDAGKVVLKDYRSQGDEWCLVHNELAVRLKWSEETDLDLHLETPGGERIHYRNRNAAGGTFLGDNCIGGDCEGELVETIIWENGASAPPGDYKVWVVNYNGLDAANYEIEVLLRGERIAAFPGSIGAQARAQSEIHTFTVSGGE